MENHDRIPNSTAKWKPFLFYFSSVFILLLAISFSFTNTNHIKIHHLKSLLPSYPTTFQKLLGIFHNFGFFQFPTKTLTPNSNSNSFPSPCVFWMAPFLSGGGYSSEAWSYILALNQHSKIPKFRLKIEHHGDLESLEFWEGLPRDVRNLAIELHQTQCRINETIVLCHSEPGAWYPPLFETLPCPPIGYKGFRHVIGRTMFETDRVNPNHVSRCNRMDSIWVPTDFHVSTFVKSGVDQSKVVKVVQPIDVEFFDPSKYTPLNLASLGSLVVGEQNPGQNEPDFVFLSVFKWEYRKGWDVLLKAYLQEFSSTDRVALYLLTNPYHSNNDFGNKIVEFVRAHKFKQQGSLAKVYVIDAHVAQLDIPRLYKSADAFVLPTRGEGWGRPIVEAMAMSLPVIATNWSGPAEYLTAENSYPLAVDEMAQVIEGPFKGHLWAQPSVDKLRVLMRRVMSNADEAKEKGRNARKDMVSRFSPRVVAGIVSGHLEKVLDEIRFRSRA